MINVTSINTTCYLLNSSILLRANERSRIKVLYNGKTTPKALLVKMIKEEEHQIKLDANEIMELTHEVAKCVEELHNTNEISNVEIICYPPYQEIKRKLDKLEIINQHMNFRKNLIRDYIQQLYLLNGFYTSEWLK
ncbi:hypothetical protein MKY41_19105 [Sporosarcina sp. FSL W7-1349]|uniref:hypothetical protein n=1 Tax=Sporosarcina sp. FSL W7-1349 TaxID=2921561 RepID=UPI0030F88F2D